MDSFIGAKNEDIWCFYKETYFSSSFVGDFLVESFIRCIQPVGRHEGIE